MSRLPRLQCLLNYQKCLRLARLSCLRLLGPLTPSYLSLQSYGQSCSSSAPTGYFLNGICPSRSQKSTEAPILAFCLFLELLASHERPPEQASPTFYSLRSHCSWPLADWRLRRPGYHSFYLCFESHLLLSFRMAIDYLHRHGHQATKAKMAKC